MSREEASRVYVTSEQVDQAAEAIERRVREMVVSGYPLADASVWAACDVQRLWGLSFVNDDPSLSEEPVPAA